MISLLLAIGPVLLFLGTLVAMDSFRLLRPSAVLTAFAWGAVAALIAMPSRDWLGHIVQISPEGFTRYAGPPIEEALKGAFVIAQIARRRVGFLIDATILGFAVGTGFAVVENLAYLRTLGDSAPPLLWAVRGLGTAVLHGAATAILAMLTKRATDRSPERTAIVWLPGWLAAASIHSAFNHVPLPAAAQTAVLLVVLPLIVVFVFQRSERSTREWMGAGLDLDVMLLELVESERFDDTRFGAYLRQLRSRFPGHVVVDMLCLLRIELELSIRAKAFVLARSAGLAVTGDEDLAACLAERDYVSKSIGATGRLALKPLRVTSDRDRWHRQLLSGIMRKAGRAARTRS